MLIWSVVSLDIHADQAALDTQAEQQRQEGGQKDDAAAEPFPAVQPLPQHEKTGDQAPDRVEGVDQPGPGGGDVALIDVLEGETEHCREDSAVDDRQNGGRGEAESGEGEQQCGGSGDQRDGGELNERDQKNIIVLQDFGHRDNVAGDQKGAECREDVSPVESASAAGCQQCDAGHRQGDAGHVDPPDPVAPDNPGDHRDEEYEEVVENPGARDTGRLDAEDEAQVGQPEGGSYDHAAHKNPGIQLFQASGANQQHDQRGQNEPAQHKQLWRDRGDADFGEKKTAAPEEGGQYEKKVYPVHGGGFRGCHEGVFFAAITI